MIRPVKPSDAEAICLIYNEYVENTRITFEEEAVSKEEVVIHIKKVILNYPWFVFENNEKILGYTYANKWKKRSAYRHSVETGIYVHSQHLGKGIGTELNKVLIQGLKKQSIHSVIAGIALPNPASIALYEKFGFEKVAHFKEVGFKLNKWVDVGYWQLILS